MAQAANVDFDFDVMSDEESEEQRRKRASSDSSDEEEPEKKRAKREDKEREEESTRHAIDLFHVSGNFLACGLEHVFVFECALVKLILCVVCACVCVYVFIYSCVYVFIGLCMCMILFLFQFLARLCVHVWSFEFVRTRLRHGDVWRIVGFLCGAWLSFCFSWVLVGIFLTAMVYKRHSFLLTICLSLWWGWPHRLCCERKASCLLMTGPSAFQKLPTILDSRVGEPPFSCHFTARIVSSHLE